MSQELSKNELLSLLCAVREKISEILKAIEQQNKTAEEYRSNYELTERAHTVEKAYIPEAFLAVVGLQCLLEFIFLSSYKFTFFFIWLFWYVAVPFLLFKVLDLDANKFVRIICGGYMLLDVFIEINAIIETFKALMHFRLGTVLVYVIPWAIAIAAVILIVRNYNQKADAENEKIRKENAARAKERIRLSGKYDQITQRISVLRQELADLTYGWYPVSDEFYSMYAVNTLIKFLADGEADTLKEALKAYRDQQHHDEMMSAQQAVLEANRQTQFNQQQLMRQMQFANIMQIQSVMLQSESNRLMQQGNDTRNNIASILQRWDRS